MCCLHDILGTISSLNSAVKVAEADFPDALVCISQLIYMLLKWSGWVPWNCSFILSARRPPLDSALIYFLVLWICIEILFVFNFPHPSPKFLKSAHGSGIMSNVLFVFSCFVYRINCLHIPQLMLIIPRSSRGPSPYWRRSSIVDMSCPPRIKQHTWFPGEIVYVHMPPSFYLHLCS